MPQKGKNMHRMKMFAVPLLIIAALAGPYSVNAQEGKYENPAYRDTFEKMLKDHT